MEILRTRSESIAMLKTEVHHLGRQILQVSVWMQCRQASSLWLIPTSMPHVSCSICLPDGPLRFLHRWQAWHRHSADSSAPVANYSGKGAYVVRQAQVTAMPSQM